PRTPRPIPKRRRPPPSLPAQKVVSMVTIDGSNIFGAAVQFQQLANPNAQQINTYFGVSGTQSLFGGGRGRTFVIRGILLGSTLEELNAAEDAFHGYADGVARTLVDP